MRQLPMIILKLLMVKRWRHCPLRMVLQFPECGSWVQRDQPNVPGGATRVARTGAAVRERRRCGAAVCAGRDRLLPVLRGTFDGQPAASGHVPGLLRRCGSSAGLELGHQPVAHGRCGVVGRGRGHPVPCAVRAAARGRRDPRVRHREAGTGA